MKETCSVIWQEERPPNGVQHCNDCGLMDHGSRIVWGEGNPKAPIIVLLDNPGAREDREGNPFICGTRQTLQQAASEVGLTENELYVTYVLKRRPRKAYDKTFARNACMQHVLAQLEEKTPKFIFCLGNTAVQHFFENDEAEVKNMRKRWHAARGFQTTVSYHPLAVRRRPNLYRIFVDDWHFLASAYRGLANSDGRNRMMK